MTLKISRDVQPPVRPSDAEGRLGLGGGFLVDVRLSLGSSLGDLIVVATTGLVIDHTLKLRQRSLHLVITAVSAQGPDSPATLIL